MSGELFTGKYCNSDNHLAASDCNIKNVFPLFKSDIYIYLLKILTVMKWPQQGLFAWYDLQSSLKGQ